MTIKFKHNYDKLSKPEFTTIRSKAFGNKAVKAKTVEVVSPKWKGSASVEAVRVCKIADIPFEVLAADIQPFSVSTRAGFVDFLNSLRAPYWSQATMESEMAIITLRKV